MTSSRIDKIFSILYDKMRLVGYLLSDDWRLRLPPIDDELFVFIHNSKTNKQLL